MNVKDIMVKDVITINEEATIKEIADLLVEKNISGVPVIDKSNKVVGMVTHKDLLYKDIEPKYPAGFEILGAFISLKGVKTYNEELRKLIATEASQIMTKNVITINENATIEKAAEIMVEKNVSKIPVVDNGKLVGLLSRADVVKYISKILT